MFRYVLKRILIFLPTLFVISLVAFWLGKIAPGDPVEACHGGVEGYEITGAAYQQIYQQMGLDKPVFYLTFTSAAYPDTLHKIPGRYHQRSLSKLIDQYGNWELIQAYNIKLKSFLEKIQTLPKAVDQNKKIEARRSANLMLETYQDRRINSYLKNIEKAVSGDSLLQAEMSIPAQELINSYQTIKNNPTNNKHLLPKILWQGTDNQYHHWFSAFIKGDFGESCQTGQTVLGRIKTPVFWTLIINSIVIILVYILAVPLGVFSALKKNTLIDKVITTGLFILFSLPTFWIGTMLLVFFTNPEYGMNWFEGAGLGNLPSNAPFWDRFWETANHLILPVFCLTYGSLAFMSRQMRGSMLEVLKQDYIRTARAKGLSGKKVVWKHSFRNALFPLITLFASVFPGVIAGSVVIENIFNIPGMGREVITAIFAKDWQLLYTILLLIAILTMLGNLIADILYAVADPRVKFN